MSYSVAPCLVRQAIDNRLNCDLIAQAREQGFVFSDSFSDADIWQGLEAAKLEQRAYWCSPDQSDWLSCKAMEATLFLIYQTNRLVK